MLTHPSPPNLPLHDRIQIALAIADPPTLKSLLTDCMPPIARSHQIGHISTKIGMPVTSRKAVDGIIQFESINCVLMDASVELEQTVSTYAHRNGTQRGHLDLARCEAETRSIGHGLTLSQALAVLTEVGFTHQQINRILHLPKEAWFKSWWSAIDSEGCFTIPFLRLIRTLHYVDGTLTVQYKDFFPNEKPSCFRSQEEQVIVEIDDGEGKGFRKMLEKINHTRQQLGVAKAVLICDRLSDLEARGFISQGISIYAAAEMPLPVQATCSSCMTSGCPMQGVENSPVLTCQQFCIACE